MQLGDHKFQSNFRRKQSSEKGVPVKHAASLKPKKSRITPQKPVAQGSNNGTKHSPKVVRHPTLVLGMKAVAEEKAAKKPKKFTQPVRPIASPRKQTIIAHAAESPSDKPKKQRTVTRSSQKKNGDLSHKNGRVRDKVAPSHPKAAAAQPATSRPPVQSFIPRRSSLPGRISGFPSFLPEGPFEDEGLAFSDEDISNALNAIGTDEAGTRQSGWGATSHPPSPAASVPPKQRSLAPPIPTSSLPPEGVAVAVSAPPPRGDRLPVDASGGGRRTSVPTVDITFEFDVSEAEEVPALDMAPSPVKRATAVLASILSAVAVFFGAAGAAVRARSGHVAATLFPKALKLGQSVWHQIRQVIPNAAIYARKIKFKSTNQNRDSVGFFDKANQRRHFQIAAVGAGILLTGLVIFLVWVFSGSPKGGIDTPKPGVSPRSASMAPSLNRPPAPDEQNAAPASAPEPEGVASPPAVVEPAVNGETEDDEDVAPTELVTITLKGVPADAEIYIDGAVFGVPVTVPTSRKAIKIEAVSPTVGTAVKRVVPSKDKTVSMGMKKASAKTAPKHKKRKKAQERKRQRSERRKRLASNPFGG